MKKRDVIVVGGSLSGAACVRELLRQGVDAVALDRDRFPRRKVCGGFLSPGAVRCLEQLDLLPEVLNAGAVEVRSACVEARGVRVDIPFERPGLGISRTVLDDIFVKASSVEQGHTVHEVRRCEDGFMVDDIRCSVVIDASGKLGRFTKRATVDEFGIQYADPHSQGSVLNFSFFEHGYGGGVSIEGGSSNFCFLIQKSALPMYLDRPDCLVTGPLAYDRLPGDFIAIGDAAGMLDPFCGEGMRHALQTGMLAARVVGAGIRRGSRYDEMKSQYESEWERQWAMKRALSAGLRRLRSHFGVGLKLVPAWVVNRLWA